MVIQLGSYVRVINGVKSPLIAGTEGRVFWVGDSSQSTRHRVRVGFIPNGRINNGRNGVFAFMDDLETVFEIREQFNE
jgi:hypothetical protein